ncbi:MAG: hypothetical protein LBP53_04445 [Candidatus Peribacteria bacterium]|jgi:anaerobic selenocysteine-containing dehydrogenase|nr:hypothetical protein [Candidatus Peribacteria bacterium]
MKQIFSAKITTFDIHNGGGLIVILNAEQAAKYGIREGDKVSLIRKGEEYVVDVALSSDYVHANQIGVTHDFFKSYPMQEGDNVLVSFTQHNPLSMQAIRKKML